MPTTAYGCRRPALLSVVVLVVLAGCTVPIGSQTGTPTEAGAGGPTVEPFPAFPADVTADTVGPYVAAFEEAYRHNAILSTAEGVTSISVGCSAESVAETADGYAVTVSCGFSWMFEHDGSVGVADGRPYDATYRVSTGGLTERVGSTL